MADTSNHKILYVSGVAKTRESMSKICRFLSYDIKLLSTCDELATADAEWDLVIIGADIAGRKDPFFIEQLQQQYAKPLLVCLTNAESEELLIRDESLDDVYYLVVPCSPLELKSVINARLRSCNRSVGQFSQTPKDAETSLLQMALHVVSEDLAVLPFIRTEQVRQGLGEQGVLLDHIQRLSAIISGVHEIDTSPGTTSPLSRSDIETLIHRASERAWEFGLECEIECLAELPDSFTSRGQGVLSLLTLLLDMSIESTPSGRISFQIAFNRQNPQLELTLSDTGESLYSAEVSLFQERYPNFFRVHQLRRSIVERLASRNGASLWFSSLPGVGNQMKLHLPVDIREDVAFGNLAALSPVTDRITTSLEKRLSILGCARDAVTHLMLSRLLAPSAPRVLLLQSHKATIQMALSAAPRLILLGLDHPGLNAVKLARQLRQSGFPGEIVALSFGQGDERKHLQQDVFTSTIRDYAGLQSYLNEVLGAAQPHSVVRLQKDILQSAGPLDCHVPNHMQLAKEDALQRELTSSFLGELTQKLPVIKEFVIQKENYERAAELTNQLAGAALMASLADLGGIFMALENALRQSRAEDALVTINRIEGVHQELLLQSDSPTGQEAHLVSETILSELPLDSQDLRGLVLGFAASLPNVIGQLQSALEVYDWDQLKGLCHEYAGASSLYGYSSLSDELKALEYYVKEKDYAPAQSKLDQIGDISRRIVRGAELVDTRPP